MSLNHLVDSTVKFPLNLNLNSAKTSNFIYTTNPGTGYVLTCKDSIGTVQWLAGTGANNPYAEAMDQYVNTDSNVTFNTIDATDGFSLAEGAATGYVLTCLNGAGDTQWLAATGIDINPFAAIMDQAVNTTSDVTFSEATVTSFINTAQIIAPIIKMPSGIATGYFMTCKDSNGTAQWTAPNQYALAMNQFVNTNSAPSFTGIRMSTSPATGYILSSSNGSGDAKWVAPTSENVFAAAMDQYTNTTSDVKFNSESLANGAAATPSLFFTSATGVGLYQSGGLNAVTAGVNRLQIDNSGDVLIRNSAIGVRTELGSDNSGVTHYRLALTDGSTRAAIGLFGTDGSDTGSDLVIWGYDDEGAASTILRCVRASNTAILGGPLFLQSLTDNDNANVVSNSYTPTWTNGTGLTFSSPQPCTYLRLGRTVIINGQVTATFAIGTSWSGTMSVPYGSPLTGTGTASCLFSSGGGVTPPIMGIISEASSSPVGVTFLFGVPVTTSDSAVYQIGFSLSYTF